eukprot:6973496-Lingulodinium_polyedra.AAC.1
MALRAPQGRAGGGEVEAPAMAHGGLADCRLGRRQHPLEEPRRVARENELAATAELDGEGA